LRRFGEVKQPEPQAAPAPGTLRLRALVDARSQLIERQSQMRNQLEQISDKLVKKLLKASLAQAGRHLATLDKEIAAALAAPEHAQLAQRLQQEPGIGLQTTAVLLAKLPELGRLARRPLGALVGVAPLNRDSGSTHHPRHIGGGRHSLRRSLWMPTLVAVRHHPAIRVFYQRLTAAGKPTKVALVACMRKLLLTLNAIARQTLFPPNIQNSLTHTFSS
jgi:transposase